MTFNLDEEVQLKWRKMQVLECLDSGDYDVVSVASAFTDENSDHEIPKRSKHAEVNGAVQASVSKNTTKLSAGNLAEDAPNRAFAADATVIAAQITSKIDDSAFSAEEHDDDSTNEDEIGVISYASRSKRNRALKFPKPAWVEARARNLAEDAPNRAFSADATVIAAKKTSKIDDESFSAEEHDDESTSEDEIEDISYATRSKRNRVINVAKPAWIDEEEVIEAVASTDRADEREMGGVDDGNGTILAPYTLRGQDLTSSRHIQKNGWDLDETSLSAVRKVFGFTLSAIKLYKYLNKYLKEDEEMPNTAAAWETKLSTFESLGFIRMACYQAVVANRVPSDGACALNIIQLGLEWHWNEFQHRVEDLNVASTLKMKVPAFAAFLLEKLENANFDQQEYRILAENIVAMKKKLTEFRDSRPVNGNYPVRIFLEASEIGCLLALFDVPAVIWVPDGPHGSWVPHCRTHCAQDKKWKCVLGNNFSGPNILRLLQNWNEVIHIALESSHCKFLLVEPPHTCDFESCISEWAEALQNASCVLPSKFLSPVKKPATAACPDSPIIADSLQPALAGAKFDQNTASPGKVPFDIPPLVKELSVQQEREIAGIRRFFRFCGEGGTLKLFKERIDETLDKMYGIDTFSGLVSPKNNLYNFCYYGPYLRENPTSADEMWELAREANVTDKITILMGIWSGTCRKMYLIRMHLNGESFSTQNISKDNRESFRGFVCYPDVSLLEKFDELSRHYKDFVRCGKLLIGENPSSKVPTWAVRKGGKQILFRYPVYDPGFGGCDASKLAAVNLSYYNLLFQDSEIAFRMGDVVTFKDCNFLFLGSTEMRLSDSWDKLFALLGALDGSEIFSCDKVNDLERSGSESDIVTAEKCLDKYSIDCLRQNKVVRPAQISSQVLKSMAVETKSDASMVETTTNVSKVETKQRDASKKGQISVTSGTVAKRKKRLSTEILCSNGKRKWNNLEFYPLTDKRKRIWHQWMVERFSGPSRLFSSWQTLHDSYSREVEEPLAFNDFAQLRWADPVLRFITRSDIQQGYSLSVDYMKWLQKHNMKKYRVMLRKRVDCGDSVSSISQSLGDDDHINDTVAEDVITTEATEKKKGGALDGQLEAMIEVAVSKSLKRLRAEDDKRFDDFEKRVGNFEGEIGNLKKKLNDGFAKQDQKLDKQDQKLDALLAAVSGKSSNNDDATAQGSFFSPNNRSTYFGSPARNNPGFSMNASSLANTGNNHHDNAASLLIKGQEAEHILLLRSIASHLEKKNNLMYA